MRKCLTNQIRIWTLFFVTLFLTAEGLYAQDPIDQEAEEDDWSLPDWVQPSDHSGIIVYDFEYFDYPPGVKDIATVGYRWRDLNPEEGVYDWRPLEDDIQNSKEVYIRIGLSDTMHVPGWLFDKYPDLRDKAFKVHEYNDFFEEDSEGYFIPFWHEGVKRELKQFFKAFKDRNFQADPKVHHMYIPGAYTWGEYSRVSDEIMERDGLTPEDYVTHFKELIDIFADAFEGHENKLVYTGSDVLTKDTSEYWRDGVGRQPSAYVVEKGLGYRTGQLEKFNFVETEMPHYGHSLLVAGGKNYIRTDDFNPMIADSGRITANENEAFCFWDYPCDYYHLKMSVLKQLQFRHRYSYTNHYAFEIDEPVHQYFILTAGKQYYDSPDAWCALREAKDEYQWWTHYPDRKDFYYANWERWLYQREVEPGGMTQRAYYIDDEPYLPANGDAYEARQTDISAGQNYIYFDVDDKFMYEGPHEVEIKVTYLDDFEGDWELQYQGSEETYQSMTATNSNDRKWKTVTFEIDDGYFANGQTGENDFRLFNGGNHDLTVRFVRIIKIKDPGIISSATEVPAKSDLFVYPNPTRNQMTVEFPMKTSKQSVTIYDISGRVVMTQNIRPGMHSVQLDVSGLPPGVFILQLDERNIQFVKN